MSAHIGKTYLDSCVKVPIDPSNNCPAPFFNRSKIYPERFSATPNSCKIIIKKDCDQAKPDTKWLCSGIRSLAKLYDSIPDYTDLNHLTGEEFYTKLNSLRSTCRALEVKTICHKPEDQCSTTTTSSSLAPVVVQAEGRRSKKSKKSKKKKSKCSTKYHKSEHTDFAQQISNNAKTKIVEDTHELNSCLKSCCTLSKSPEKDSDKEVEKLKKSLDEFEAEFKRRFNLSNRTESRPIKSSFSKEYANKATKHNKQSIEKVPARSTFIPPTLRERLRKSLSFNDLHSLAEPPELEDFKKENKILSSLSFKAESNFSKDTEKLSNYFKENSKPESTEIPQIIVDLAETDNSSIKQKSTQNCLKNEEYKIPFKLFHLDSSIKGKHVKQSTPPIHPVARPNLAATLRAESSKKKVQELKTNCTFHDSNAQFDWEVRKTPAWKTLSLNETHKQILKLRLATRKAEQALQQREYELNMELMRQRVKSAPLLLEGTTHWGPQVGKLTHSCQRDERHHLCHRTKRRNNSSHGQNCRRRLFSITSTLEEDNSINPANTFRIQTNSRAEVKQKMNELRKIYGSSTNLVKSQSRSSNRSTTMQTSLKNQKRIKSKNVQKKEKKILKAEANFEGVEIDSGDELSSLDRAFL